MVDLNITLPEGYLNEEVRCGYTVSKQMKEVWAVELDLAQQLIDVCNRNHIKIMTFAGTTLGAIRHNGFIPWDDDIDFIISRADYNKLCEIGPYEFESPYFFQTEYTDPGSLRGHAQLRNSNTTGILDNGDINYRFNQGIFIDIFPYDNIPDSDIELRIFLRKSKRYQKIYRKIALLSSRYSLARSKNPLKRILKSVAHYAMSVANKECKLERVFFKKFETLMSSYDDVKTNRCGTISFLPDEQRFYFSAGSVADVTDVPFEFLRFPIPVGWQEHLTNAYGDYNKFVIGGSVHGGVIFDTDKSYKYYLKAERTKLK